MLRIPPLDKNLNLCYLQLPLILMSLLFNNQMEVDIKVINMKDREMVQESFIMMMAVAMMENGKMTVCMDMENSIIMMMDC